MVSGRGKLVVIVAAIVVVIGAVVAVLVVVLKDRGSVGGPHLPEGPIAHIAMSPTSGITPDTLITFSAEDSVPGVAGDRLDEVRYGWDLGDGTTAAGETVTYQYSSPGGYEVRLAYEVFYSEGRFGRSTASVPVDVQAPPLGELEASIVYDSERFWRAGENVTFDGAQSQFSAGESESLEYRWEYVWDFGDGTPEVRGSRPSHTFNAPGDYAVTLLVQVRDQFDRGLADSTVQTVHIQNRPPVVCATVHPTGGADRIEPGRAVVLDASESYDPDGGILTFAWDIDGDGFTDVTTPHAQYRYEPGFAERGEYSSRVQVWDEYMTVTQQQPVVDFVHVLVGRPTVSLPPGEGLDLGRFVLSGGLATMGDFRLLNASVGMEFADGNLLTSIGYGACLKEVSIPLTDQFPVVENAGYDVAAVVQSANLLGVSAYYQVRPRVYLGGSLGYLTCKGFYDASCRVSIGGKLPPVSFTSHSVLVGLAVGYRWGFSLLTLSLLFAL
jgi:hypothetical protein